jgi:hypothetical protein
MGMWGNLNEANNAPKYIILPTSNATGNMVYGNTTLAAFVNNEIIDLYGVPGANNNPNGAHAGWTVETVFTGPVSGFAVANAGGDYTNGDYILVSNGTLNAYGTITTTNTGGVLSVAVGNSAGAGFVNTSSAVLTYHTANTEANGAVVTVTLGGRAGRKQYETLVAMSSIMQTNTGADPI